MSHESEQVVLLYQRRTEVMRLAHDCFRGAEGMSIMLSKNDKGASNADGVGRNRDSEPISGFTAYAVKRSSCKCSKLSCNEPCRVYNTSRW